MRPKARMRCASVNLQDEVDFLLPIKLFHHSGSPGLTEFAAKFGRLRQLYHRLGCILDETLPPGWFNQDSGALVQIVRRTSPFCCDDGQSHRHRLEHDGSTALVEAREH